MQSTQFINQFQQQYQQSVDKGNLIDDIDLEIAFKTAKTPCLMYFKRYHSLTQDPRNSARKAYSIILALGEAKPLHFLHIVLLRARNENYLISQAIQTLSNQGGLTVIYRSFESHVLAVLNSLAVNTRVERIQRLRNLQLDFLDKYNLLPMVDKLAIRSPR